MSKSSDLLRADYARRLAERKKDIQRILHKGPGKSDGKLLAVMAEFALFEIGLLEEDATLKGNPNN